MFLVFLKWFSHEAAAAPDYANNPKRHWTQTQSGDEKSLFQETTAPQYDINGTTLVAQHCVGAYGFKVQSIIYTRRCFLQCCATKHAPRRIGECKQPTATPRSKSFGQSNIERDAGGKDPATSSSVVMRKTVSVKSAQMSSVPIIPMPLHWLLTRGATNDHLHSKPPTRNCD